MGVPVLRCLSGCEPWFGPDLLKYGSVFFCAFLFGVGLKGNQRERPLQSPSKMKPMIKRLLGGQIIHPKATLRPVTGTEPVTHSFPLDFIPISISDIKSGCSAVG